MTLPGYEAQRVLEMQWAFSSKKQADYDTLVVDGDLTMSHPVREVRPAEISKETRSDREAVGKGHEFSTDLWEVARSTALTRVVDGSSYILGWLVAFALGKVASTQPDLTNCPDAWQHECTFFDPDTEGSAQLPITTIVEKISAATALKRYLHSMAVSGLTISAEGFEHLSASADFIGSGEVSDSALTMPDIPEVSYLTSSDAVILLGDASENITTRIRSWSVAINNDPKEARGYFPSSGLYRGRLEAGVRSIVPALVVDLAEDSDLLDDFLSNTELALEILCEGDLVNADPCTVKHSIKFEFPNLLYSAMPIDEADGVYTYGVTFSEEGVLYKTGATPAPLVQITVVNKTTSYLT
ncbi:hypothetical protein ES703_40875 [subsurface metagenome]